MVKVGEQLQRAREGQKLTIQDIAEQTKIRTDHLAALEEGNYDVFSAPIYIRGFVRSYARVLKLNVANVLADLDSELLASPKFKEPPRLTEESKTFLDFILLQFSKINWKVTLPLVALAIILMVSLFAYRTWQNHKTEDPLKNLGPGLYEPRKKQSGETLPLPPAQTNSRPN